MSAPFGVSDRILLVIRSSGERHFIEKTDNIDEWAKGLDVTIIEYRATRVIRTPPKT